MSLQNAPAKAYKQLVSTLLSTAQSNMADKGFEFGSSGIVADWTTMRKRRTGPVTIKFPNILLARAFHYQFKDYEWESDNDTQTIIIRLQNELFDAEMVDPHGPRACI